jgi:uncharacterized protein YbjQ (UPF0145 family)
MMNTLSEIPGFQITKVLGLVTELASASGFTAETKGANALDAALTELGRSAALVGANAVVGFQASAFGARGGITSAFGGDAVGILLVGTAVVVEATSGAEAPPPGVVSPGSGRL